MKKFQSEEPKACDSSDNESSENEVLDSIKSDFSQSQDSVTDSETVIQETPFNSQKHTQNSTQKLERKLSESTISSTITSRFFKI